MAGRTDRSRWLTAALILILVGSLPLPALADDHCYYDPIERAWVCDDGGGGGGSGGGPSPTDYWTAWTLVAPCGSGAVVGGLIDIGTGSVLAARYHYVDGEVVDSQYVCIDLDDGQNDAWEATAQAAQALPDPGWESDPDPSISKGLTGLETWIWSSHGTQVGPVATTWVEPVTGIVFAVEGRGWTESITWDTGEGTYDVFSPDYFSAQGMGGTVDDPPVVHLYETTSLDAGYGIGYPVSIGLLWVGEYRVGVNVAGGTIWTDWARVTSTLTETFPDRYEVVEVRSKLRG
jgi:hypothetical protein